MRSCKPGALSKKYDDTRFVDGWAKYCFERIRDAAETAADLFS